MVLHFKLLNGCDFCGSVLLVFMLIFFVSACHVGASVRFDM